MEQLILRQDIVEAIKADFVLQAKIAQVLGRALPTMFKVLAKPNNPTLTQASVLKVLREHLGINKDSDLLTELQAA